MSTNRSSSHNAESDATATCQAEKPAPLTKVVHEAIMSLAMNFVVVQNPNRWEGDYQRLVSPMDKNLHFAYKDALQLLLLGVEFNFEALFLSMASYRDLERVKVTIKALPKSSPSALQRATKFCRDLLDTEMLDSNGNYWTVLKEATKDRLGTNIRSLDWCNDIWFKLFATGAAKTDVVKLFVSAMIAAVQARCPVQEFPSQWYAIGSTRTLDELDVMQLSATIREKPGWKNKLHDDAIVSKWREEAYEQNASPSMVDFLIAELHWFADQLDPKTGIDYSGVPGVFFTDNLIPPVDRETLCEGANALAAVPDNQKDWHPKSNGQVLDLIHPSLYPYVRGRTRRFLHEEAPSWIKPSLEINSKNMDAVAASILCFLNPPSPHQPFSAPVDALGAFGQGVIASPSMTDPDIIERKWRSNSNYQWLPVDVEISAGPPYVVRFLSYVNNLHPAKGTPGASLYPVLERIFSRFVPLFERTLTETRRRRTGTAGARTQFIRDHVDEYWDPPEPNYDALSGSDTDTAYDEVRDNWLAERRFIRPVVGAFVPPPPPGPAQVTLGGMTVQVIIKMANVHITPENPEFPGGSWHVEGTDNERIVATGIYYYESENISESSLSFRQAVEEPEYEQNEYEHLEELYGMTPGLLEDDPPANQNLGTVITPEGRCICFPNGIQHRLSPFRLTDPTKPGYRKILVFFLVDPSRRILSTSDVPPQQLEWLLHEVHQQVGTRLSTLPPELFNLICAHVADAAYTPLREEESPLHWLMPLAEAKEHRLALMKERADFAGAVNDILYERKFNLCEH